MSGSFCKRMRSGFKNRRKYSSNRTGQTSLIPRQWHTSESAALPRVIHPTPISRHRRSKSHTTRKYSS